MIIMIITIIIMIMIMIIIICSRHGPGGSLALPRLLNPRPCHAGYSSSYEQNILSISSKLPVQPFGQWYYLSHLKCMGWQV